MTHSDSLFYLPYIGWFFGIYEILEITDYNLYSICLTLKEAMVVLTASEFASALGLKAIVPKPSDKGRFISEPHNKFNKGKALHIYEEVCKYKHRV